MRQALLRGGAALLQAYYRHVPLSLGKRPVWHEVVGRLVPRAEGLAFEATTRFGARMHVRFPDTIQSHVYFFGVWEPAITAYVTRALAPGDIMIDIGANVGYDTLLAGHLVGPGGHVHAIEASPRIHALLLENLELNGVSNVSAHAVAATDSVCSVPVYLHEPRNLGGTTIVPAVARSRGARLEATVPGRPLPAIVPEEAIRAARLIKIDVEGAEWSVVQGFVHLLPELSHRSELLIETSAEGLRAHGVSIPAFLDVFRRAGFTPWVIVNRYEVGMYLETYAARPVPLTGEDFDQLDLLFRRE